MRILRKDSISAHLGHGLRTNRVGGNSLFTQKERSLKNAEQEGNFHPVTRRKELRYLKEEEGVSACLQNEVVPQKGKKFHGAIVFFDGFFVRPAN